MGYEADASSHRETVCVYALAQRAGCNMKALIVILFATCCGCGAFAADESAVSVLTPSSSDRATVEQHRDVNGNYHIVIGGDRYDGRRLIKALIAQLGALDGGGWAR